jgi:hypothetical protein
MMAGLQAVQKARAARPGGLVAAAVVQLQMGKMPRDGGAANHFGRDEISPVDKDE